MEKLFGDSAAQVTDGVSSVVIIVLLILGVFILFKFGRKQKK